MPIDTKAILLEVKENYHKLASCARHDFKPIPPDPQRFTFTRYSCTKCGGKIDSIAYAWYELGLKHASQ